MNQEVIKGLIVKKGGAGLWEPPVEPLNHQFAIAYELGVKNPRM